MTISPNLYLTAVRQAEAGLSVEEGILRIYREVNSTMPIVDRLITEGHPVGTTVIALEQTEGRGCYDMATDKVRKWWSGKGNLMFSRIVSMKGYAKEAEYIAALAVAEIVAELLPRATVIFKCPNDILVNGAKIGGFLVLTDDKNFYSEAAQKINLGVGVNLAVTPPADIIREKTTVTSATCLKDHGVDIGIADFMSLFDAKFDEIMEEYLKYGFVHVLKRIGFADRNTGEISLHRHCENTVITGTYCGLKTQLHSSGAYVNGLCLKGGDKIEVLPTREYTATAIIENRSAGVSLHQKNTEMQPHA